MRRSVDSWLDRFCYQHPKLGIPNLMMYISIGNVAVMLLDMFSNYTFSSLISFVPAKIFSGQIWRLVTFIFVPTNANILWFLVSLSLYFFLGRTLEREWGSVKFTVYYGMGVLLNIVYGLLMGLLGFGFGPTANMYYVNMSLFFAFATLYPDMTFMIYFILPLKAKWLAWFDAALFAFSIFTSLMARDLVGALLPVVAVLNYIFFFWSDIMALFGHVKHKTSRQTVNFKQATRQAQQQKGYLHKCAVCGKTDTDHPELEFRYCSKCNGYYCYCMDHITNHVHIE